MRIWPIYLALLCSFNIMANELKQQTQKAIEYLSTIEGTLLEAPPSVACFTPETLYCHKFLRFKQLGVPEDALKQAMLFSKLNSDKITKSRYISIADYSQSSTKKRFYILDMETGTLRVEKVSHGSGHRSGFKYGDPEHDGMINRCHHGENIKDRTNMTRAGFFRTANLYRSVKHDRLRNGVQEWPYLNDQKANGMRMHGLSPGVNDEAYSSGVVMHGAWYNDLASIMGRSYGCPAFTSKVASEVLNTIKDGTLYYSYTPICKDLHQKVLKQIPGWGNFCQ